MLDKLLASLGNQVAALNLQIQKLFKQQEDASNAIASGLSSLASAVKEQKPPVVNVSPPEVKVTVPNVIVPEIKVPEITVNVPEVKLPTINVPKPEVTVNVPEIKVPDVKIEPPVVNVTTPDEVKVVGLKDLATGIFERLGAILKRSIHDDVDRLNPVPVLLVDEQGNAYKAKGGGSITSLAGGGSGPQDEGFGIPKHSERVLNRDGSGKLTSIDYKLQGTVIATLTLTRDGTGKLSNVKRTL